MTVKASTHKGCEHPKVGGSCSVCRFIKRAERHRSEAKLIGDMITVLGAGDKAGNNLDEMKVRSALISARKALKDSALNFEHIADRIIDKYGVR